MNTLLDLEFVGTGRTKAYEIKNSMKDRVEYFDFDDDDERYEGITFLTLSFDGIKDAKEFIGQFRDGSEFSEYLHSAVIIHGTQLVQLVGNHVFFRK